VGQGQLYLNRAPSCDYFALGTSKFSEEFRAI
jgi:hypothetical protein